MANILNITAADSGKTFPLRGDMAPVLNFTPVDNHFRVAFMTQDAGTFPISSSAHPFRALNAGTQSALSVGGKVGLFIELMYDTDKNEFVVTKNNLVAGEAVTGGGTGTAATITVAQTVTGAPGTAALVENIGTASAVQLKFTIPQGAAGTGSTGTTYGLPAGGAAGQVLGKTGSGDYAVGWVTPTAGSGGGTVNTSEIVVTPDTNGNVELNAALGSNFRLVVNRAVKILNPVGFTGASQISLITVVGSSGAFPITWDTFWAFPDSLPPSFATLVGGINHVRARQTNSDTWVTDVTPDRTVTAGYGTVRPIARIGTDYYYGLANAAGTGAFNHVVTGNTVYILRSGKAAEATGTIYDDQGGSYTIAGVAIGGTGEQRPLLQLMKSDYSEGPPRGANRPSFGKQVLGAEGGPVGAGKSGSTYVIRDLRITGGRNDDGDCRGIGQNGQATLTVQNVDIVDNNNGILTDNATNTPLTILDSLLDANGVGTPNTNANQGNNSSGYVHNIYAGHNGQTLTIRRSTISNSLTGHNIKSRAAVTILDRVLCIGATNGRELDLPNGGIMRATNCEFHKNGNATQNNLIDIGNTFGAGPNAQEAVDTSRPREYTFTNCRFINDVDPVRDTTFVANRDPGVRVTYIDCEWVGAGTFAKNNPSGPSTNDTAYAGMFMKNGDRFMPGMDPVYTFTGGPVGPLQTPGKPSNVAMTPVV